MGLVTEARRVLERMPPDLRERLESIAAWVPRHLLYGSSFRDTRSRVRVTQWWDGERRHQALERDLRSLVHYAYETVPYYRELFDREGIRPEDVRGTADLARLPLLERDTLRHRRDVLVSRAVPRHRRELVSTGGSTGAPLSLWLERGRAGVEWAFVTLNWERAGYVLGDRRAVLRGWVPPDPARRLYEIHPLLDEIVLSTFHLHPGIAGEYARRMGEFGARFLVAYPSSAEAFARALRAAGAVPPRLEAILLSSEVLYDRQRRELESLFGGRVFSYYGQSEKSLLAGECEHSSELHFFPEYGHLEVLRADGTPAGPGETGEIVATSFVNRTTVLLRYRTLDLGTVASGPCACGRASPRLVRVEGRQQDLLVGRDGTLISVSALNTHSPAFAGVDRFRIVQEVAGEAGLELLPGPGFDGAGAARCAAEYEERTGGAIRFTARVVSELPLTGRGKYRFVEQRIASAAITPSSESAPPPPPPGR